MPQRDVDRMAPRIAFLASAAVATFLILVSIGAYSSNYDEGVYWQSLLSLDAGHRLFSEVFSSQPPLFLYAVLPGFHMAGQSLVAARLTMVVFALVGVVAIVTLGRRTSRGTGWFAGALFLTSLVGASVAVTATAPSISTSVAGVALASHVSTIRGRGRVGLAFIAGLLLAAATMIKLLGLVAVVPAVLALVITQARVTSERADMHDSRSIGHPAPVMPILALISGLVLGIASVAALTWHHGAFYDQVVRFHLDARSIRSSTLDNFKILIVATLRSPLLLGAALAVVLAACLRIRAAIVPVAWLAIGAIFLLVQHPMFADHRLVLAPPASLLVASLPAWISNLSSDRVGPLAPKTWATIGVSAVVAVALISVSVTALTQPTSPGPRERAMIAAVTAQVPPSTPVVTDDQYLVADAGRETPAELVDTSYVRIESGWLPLDELTRVTTAEHAAVLFTGGRLDKVPGFRSWVDQHAIKVASFPDGGALYLPR